jgi:ssDNA-binding Zn-finger/Zn-ribbon topoisomerase 1/SAM-dependent methyltransferase
MPPLIPKHFHNLRMTKGKSKKELLTEQIAAAVGAGREVAVETVDFSDPNRPKTCLEVDFPIIPINQIAAIEGNAGKPIYQMSKWWARRRSSVFRSMLLAAAMRAPADESQAAKAVWEVYYANHQKRGALRHLKVAEPFMGGGTTIVEGSRLGMQMFGCDLNPVAWFVVKNEMAPVDLAEVKRLLADIEAEVKPLIMPYYACDGPDGEKGKWFRRAGTKKCEQKLTQSDLLGAAMTESPATEDEWEELPASFDIFSVPWPERRNYRYEGPEIIYTFWAKHGPCQRAGCGHRTPIMKTPVVAIKTLTVDAWPDWECRDCGKKFDVERHAARMAPDAPLFVAPDEKPFAVMDSAGRFTCPHCGKTRQDAKALAENNSSELGKAKNKKVELTLLIHPQWLEGCPKCDEQGREYGGSATDSVEATTRWNNARAAKLRLLEVRGVLPEQVTCPETKVTFYTDIRGGTAPLKKNKRDELVTEKSAFACATDGTPNDVQESVKVTGKPAPMAAYIVHAYSYRRDSLGFPYSGRFFAPASDTRRTSAAASEWTARKDNDLRGFWPTSAVLVGEEIGPHDVQGHQLTHWWRLFAPLQLLSIAQILKSIVTNPNASWQARECVLDAFQQYLRNQNLFCFYDRDYDKLVPAFSSSNFQPKSHVCENGVFSPLGRGNWRSCWEGVIEGHEWALNPWEAASTDELTKADQNLAKKLDGKSMKVACHDSVLAAGALVCGSATELESIATDSCDLVVTDPPFGNLVQYAELADFFYVWLRLALKGRYPQHFEQNYTPKTLEAVANRFRQPKDPNAFYQRVLTDSWREAFRVLKPGGILAFTFHHSEDEPWVGVLESLFDAGFYLEATYPIRSDETKGDGEFGSKQIEYDIIHVCRKRMAEPQPISWARLRRQITEDVRRLKTLLSQHQQEGLPAADLQVIKRGKALEYFSRHYGKVYVEQGREFTLREALVGINLLLDDDTATTGGPEAPPANAEPYTRQFFRLFYETTQVPRDQMQKFLRGTGIAPSDFEERGWCAEKNKVFTLTPPVELARAWKGASRKGMARDFDQTMFLVGGCVAGSNLRVTDTLDSPNFAPHPATDELVGWLARHGGTEEIKHAAQRARTIYRDWLSANKLKVEEQMRLFDLEG